MYIYIYIIDVYIYICIYNQKWSNILNDGDEAR